MTRTAAEISRGLAPARPARAIRAGERIHVLGVGGAASAGAAIHAAAVGAHVTACDASGVGHLAPAIAAAGVRVATSHDAGHIVGEGGKALVDRLAVTKAITSVHPDHPEMLAAAGAGIEPEQVQQVIADAAATRGRRLIGVTGTHGKSTTAGWLLHLLADAGRDPSGFVGAPLPAELAMPSPSVARIGRGRDFVVEADEYAGNFDPYRPAIGCLISVEWDHPDVFPDEDAVVATYLAWIRAFEGGAERPVLVANVGDRGVRRVVAALGDWAGRILTVELVAAGRDDRAAVAAADASGGIAAAVVAEDEAGVELAVAGLAPGRLDRVRLQLAGRHMAADGLVAAGGALAAGVDAAAIVRGLASFRGVGRRMEVKGDVGGVVVLDDYAHHPTAIRATYAAVRQRYPGRRLWAVYEPLTYHRTAAMLDAFAEVLAEADRAAVIDIWAIRDPDTTITSAKALADATTARASFEALATGSPEASGDRLADLVEPGDVVLVMGGGRSTVAAERLVERLSERQAR